jgi:hypothetical protein
MTLFYFDIETIPTTNKMVIDSIRESITPPGNYKKPESIAEWMATQGEEAFQQAYRKTALDGLYGEIISIAWAFGNDDPSVLNRRQGDREDELLDAFFVNISSLKTLYGNKGNISKWIGHYISGFDLRFLWQRCVVNDVKPPIAIPYDAKPWDDRIFDTKVAWTGSSQYSGAGSLDKLSLAIFGEGKGEINGANVYDYWLAGKYQEIADYNVRDVEMCRKLYKKMTFQL